MQTLRASAIALPFVCLAVLVALLSDRALNRWYHRPNATDASA